MDGVNERIQKNSKRIVTLLIIFLIILVIATLARVASMIQSISVFLDSTAGMHRAETAYAAALGAPLTEIFHFSVNVFFVVIIVLTIRIFKTISDTYSPFVSPVPKHMKIISLLLLCSGILTKYALYFATSIITGQITFTLIDESVLLWLIFAGICYCFAMIFDYGCTLQNEIDEIL